MADRVPENALLSHDLFEGVFARAGLVTDVELFDEFPSNYLVSAARQHRWARGDWQLLPWILGRARDATGQRSRSSHPGHRPLEDGRQPPPDAVARRSRWPPCSRPGRSRRCRPALWTAFVARAVVIPAGAARPRRAAAATAGHLQAQPPAGRRRRRRRSPRAHVVTGPHVPRPPGVADGRRDRAHAGAAATSRGATCSNGRPPRRRRPAMTSTSPASTGGWPAAWRSRPSPAFWSSPSSRAPPGSPRRSSCCGCCRPSIARWVSLPAAESAAEQLSAADVERAPPDRPPHLAVLRDVRRPRGPRAAARQLPGRPAAGRRASHVADEHRHVPAGDRHRSRLRLDRHARDGRAARGDARDHRRASSASAATSTTGTTRATCSALEPAYVSSVDSGNLARPPAHVVERLPPDDRPAASGRGRARGDRRCDRVWRARPPTRSATIGEARRSPGGTSTRRSTGRARPASTSPRRPKRGRPR